MSVEWPSSFLIKSEIRDPRALHSRGKGLVGTVFFDENKNIDGIVKFSRPFSVSPPPLRETENRQLPENINKHVAEAFVLKNILRHLPSFLQIRAYAYYPKLWFQGSDEIPHSIIYENLDSYIDMDMYEAANYPRILQSFRTVVENFRALNCDHIRFHGDMHTMCRNLMYNPATHQIKVVDIDAILDYKRSQYYDLDLNSLKRCYERLRDAPLPQDIQVSSDAQFDISKLRLHYNKFLEFIMNDWKAAVSKKRSKVESTFNKKCLDVLANSPWDGAQVGLYTCHGQPNQMWVYDKCAQLLVNNNSMCLAVDLMKNNNIVQRPCPVPRLDLGQHPERRWIYDEKKKTFTSAHVYPTGKHMCLDVNMGDSNKPLILYECKTPASNQNQRFNINNLTGGSRHPRKATRTTRTTRTTKKKTVRKKSKSTRKKSKSTRKKSKSTRKKSLAHRHSVTTIL